jgi:hypothetical protein
MLGWGVGYTVVIAGIIVVVISSMTSSEIMEQLRGGHGCLFVPPEGDRMWRWNVKTHGSGLRYRWSSSRRNWWR